ncbi:hypothetical protein Dsin_010032 [Dipteronia sinensis]|uniref:DUF8040 domain-containing protein n=1 Tax=Dipteronia sinensis TaxID=43782 RepID=A0AAE0ARZ3_9ROSI|nr:hypothetical protein Dsin_010032 [Dipteronia sinensis]
MELVDVDVDVDVDDKVGWSTRNDVIFIRILHEHVKKAIYRHLHSIRGGFGSDPISNTLTAPEAVWVEYIKDREVEDNFINLGVHVNVDVEAGDDDDDGGGGVELTEDSNKKKGKRARRSIDSSSNLRKNKWESMDTYFRTAKEVMQARLEKVKVKSAEFTGKSCEQFSVTECMEAVESLGDIDGGLTGYAFVQELLNGHPERMYNMFRMDTHVFLNLCQTLEQSLLLEDDRHVTVIKGVGRCFYILSHGAVMQRLVPIACCILHNFVRSQGRGDIMFREYENEDMLIDGEGEREGEGRPIPNIDLSSSNAALMSNVRDEIAKKKMRRDCSRNRK